MNSNSLNSIKLAIDHWNECRIPILRISYPDESHTFKGAMRFYFQDAGQKVATKCVNVTSAQTTKQVIDILIEKFRPDMRMLSMSEYGLYEIHENGDERKLDPDERPLYIELSWNQDDRDGRFLLRKIAEKTHDLTSQQESSLKKQDQQQQSSTLNASNKQQNGKNNIAATLYNEVPQTSLTRSISNPEAVMKRRRAQNLGKLHGLGGTLRIFGDAIDKKVAYKTLLASTKDTASTVVKQVLEKYGKESEDSANYCLVCVVVNSLAENGEASLRESILNDNDLPLQIQQTHDMHEGALTFHIRPRKHRSNGTLPRQYNNNHISNQHHGDPMDFANNNNNNNHIPNSNNNNNVKQLPQQMVPNNHFLAGPQQHSLPHIPPQQQLSHPPQYIQATSQNQPILPSLIRVEEDVEDIFLSRVITQVEPTETQFRLAPTYVLYMVSRYRASTLFHPELEAPDRAKLFEPFTSKIAQMIRASIEFHKSRPAHLAFWLANSSDLNHFYKQDKHLSHFTIDAQKILFNSITSSFQYLLHCKQQELDEVLHTFFAEADDHQMKGDMSLGRSMNGGTVSIAPILDVLEDTMATMRKNRVNAALTIQIFSHLFHHISRWLFDRLIGVYDRQPNMNDWQSNFAVFCNRVWGLKFSDRLAMIRGWAEKQGLEQAADFHLARVCQVAMFLSWQYPPRITPQDVREVCDKCDRLNPKQIRALLERYQPEQQIISAIIDNIIFNMDYSYVANEYPLEEDFELKIPFLIPDDGYSSEMIRFIPKSLIDFVDKLRNEIVNNQPLCKFEIQRTSSGFWTVYFKNNQPDIIWIQLKKLNNSMGLSILGARSAGGLGIYIKNVVKNGAAAMDGRLQAGDQLLEVDGNSLLDIDQEAAANLMKRTGPIVTLKIAKQAAIYHNIPELNDMGSQPPIVAAPIVAPPSFVPPPPREQIRQNQVPDRRPVPPTQVHPPMSHVAPKYPPQPDIPADPRMVQFQNMGHTAQPVERPIAMYQGPQKQLLPERHVNFQPPPPPPPAMMFDESIVTPPAHPIQNATSPLKSPKKVSWVDTQPHQSLHTLIPPSPAPIPSPTAQESSSPIEVTNGQTYGDDHDAEDDIPDDRIDENAIMDAFGKMPLPSEVDNNNEHLNAHHQLLQQHQQEHRYDDESEELMQQQIQHHEQQLQQQQQQQQRPQQPNGQLDTTTESLTLEDIDEVLSSETHNNWPEDSSGVIGTQEVYNDPRQRIVKERERPNAEVNIEKLSFQEKLKMFNISAKK